MELVKASQILNKNSLKETRQIERACLQTVVARIHTFFRRCLYFVLWVGRFAAKSNVWVLFLMRVATILYFDDE